MFFSASACRHLRTECLPDEAAYSRTAAPRGTVCPRTTPRDVALRSLESALRIGRVGLQQAGSGHNPLWNVGPERCSLHDMDDETRAAFARIDRYFELNQAQYNDLRHDVADLRQDVADLRQTVGGLPQAVAGLHVKVDDLRQEVGGLRREIDALREEFHRFRDWVAAQLAEIRVALRQLTVRVERLEYRQS
jgi:predicted nuclease with TOPRIM domain